MGKYLYCGLSFILMSSGLTYAAVPELEQYRGMQGQGAQFKDFKRLTKEGYISQKPQVSRYDYNDVFKVKKPLKFAGQEVIYLTDEYMSEYIGCCVSEGWGALFKKTSALTELKNFANANFCSLKPFDPKDSKYYTQKITAVPQAEYYELSCRERDLERGN